MQARVFRRLGAALLACLSLTLVEAGVLAQSLPTVRPPVPTSRIEIYGAYSYFHPYKADIDNFYSEPIDKGAIGGVNYFFNRFLGVEAEGGYHPHGPNDCAFTAQGGVVARYQLRHFVPFAHVLGGGAKLGGPVFQPCTWGYGGTAGLGFDYAPHAFGSHIAIRPVQADYEYNRVDYGPLVLPGGYSGGLMKMNAYRLSSGLVLRFGNLTPAMNVAMSCSATPGDVYAGEPVTIESQTLYLDTHRKTNYFWDTTGGQLSGTRGDTVQINTAGLAPGTYTVTGKLQQGRMAEQQADCITRFAVKQVAEPPTITCSANPASVHAGQDSVITSVGTSTRPLTYSYSATSGTITGNTSTATLDTGGVVAGDITIRCNVVDDLGKSAMATTVVQVLPPVVPPRPQTQALCSIAFNRDRKRPARVDNEAKGCLDDIALTLQRQSDSTLVIVGSHASEESPDVAAQRAVNTKTYLTKEKGIDPARIHLRSGAATDRRVYPTLVPSGAIFSADDSSRDVDESTVHIVGQAYSTTPPAGMMRIAPRRSGQVRQGARTSTVHRAQPRRRRR